MKLFCISIIIAFLISGATSCAGKAAVISGDIPDDTEFIQGLLDSEGSEITIPARETPWITRPLFLTGKSEKTIRFEPGCRITAKEGEFIDTEDSLLSLNNCSDIILTGYEAVLEMRKSDYTKRPYKKSQWRHGISIRECESVTIEGLTIRFTGGDGVYLGQAKGEEVNRNIVLKDLRLEDNHRQGVSVISVEGFIMEGCIVTGTKGTQPMAGIDFEPNSNANSLTGCVIRDTVFENNSGAGILFYFHKLKAKHPPVDITFENCISRNNMMSVLMLSVPRGLRGSIRFIDCDLSDFKRIKRTKTLTVDFL
ncbi:MAG: right-handed parallel beta-helix repeat-containing protein [Spirochaetaceae bacterium]|jgi:hypothetical protein|nr:right-handed parallel beta-helix repeat-containing protein [Spirochaetaceae bacterium]